MKTKNATIIAALIAVIGVIIGAWLDQTGFFTSADIRFKAQLNDNVCPPELNLNSGDFVIYFSNENGNRDADLFAKISSPNNISFTKNNVNISLPVGASSHVSFKINTSSIEDTSNPLYTNILIDNVTIIVMAKYEFNSFKNTRELEISCNYKVSGYKIILEKEIIIR